MNPLILPILSAVSSIWNERIKTTSTVDGVVAAASAVAVAAGVGDPVGLPPDSLEAYIVSVVLGLVGLYRVFKKDQVK